MIEQDKISAKEIKEGMSPTPWEWMIVDAVAGQDYENKRFDNDAAITAVNNTYGKGLNPEMYEDVVKALEWSIENLMWLRCSSNTIYELQEILKKASI